MDQPQGTDRTIGLRWGCAIGWSLPIVIVVLLCLPHAARSEDTQIPTPTIDRLATPVMPANPTPIDLGRQVYYLNCMPCHGDVGQGLTDEWRSTWVEDHQNCWGRGCHGGRVEDEGFPLPKTIPAVMGPTAALTHQHTFAELLAYLQQTHPPQRPGALQESEYEEVTTFVWYENHHDEVAVPPALIVIVAGVLALVAIGTVQYYRVHHRDRKDVT